MTTVLITGPTRGLGRATTLALARHPEITHLVLLGRRGAALHEVSELARKSNVTVGEVGCDLSSLADVRAAATAVRDLVETGQVGPLDALVANAGAMSADTRRASADGYELTFAVNYLAHAQLIGDLLDSFADPARVVLIGSNTYHANVWRRLLHVPAADWRDPLAMAKPADGDRNPGTEASGTAYSNAKLAILYYAHELQRRVGRNPAVVVYEPGWMPGTSLGRESPATLQAVGRGLSRLPGISTPERSGPVLASVAVDGRWAGLRDGAFVVRDKIVQVKPVAHDRVRENRLWDATAELLGGARRT